MVVCVSVACTLVCVCGSGPWCVCVAVDPSVCVWQLILVCVWQWTLVCDKSHLKDLSQTVLVVGVMVGAMGFSALSDCIGRKPVFLCSQWAMVIVGVASAYVTNFYAFLVLRFITGTLQQVRNAQTPPTPPHPPHPPSTHTLFSLFISSLFQWYLYCCILSLNGCPPSRSS